MPPELRATVFKGGIQYVGHTHSSWQCTLHARGRYSSNFT